MPGRINGPWRLERRGSTVVPEGLYLYGVIGTGETRNFGPIGIGGRSDPVTTIAYRDLSAVVSGVPMDRYVVGQEIMLAHERVLEEVMRVHTLLPARFYTIAPHAEGIRGLLRTRYTEFKRLLRELDNKVELGLKALWKDMNDLLAEVAVGSGHAGGHLSSDGTETAQRTKLALDRKRAEAGESLLRPLRPLASDVRLNRTYGDDMIMNAAFLVDRSREWEFDVRVELLTIEYSEAIEFKYVGPAPPYSFVNIVIKE